MFADLFGQPISEGTLAAAVHVCAEALAETERRIQEGIGSAPIAHFEETGMEVEGQRGWLHTASTPRLTYSAYLGKRGSTATEEMGILPELGGRAIHDAFSAYGRYDCKHGLCNVHHLRELIVVHEQMQRAWAFDMKPLLLDPGRRRYCQSARSDEVGRRRDGRVRTALCGGPPSGCGRTERAGARLL